MTNMESTECLICGAVNTFPVTQIDVEQLVAKWIQAFGIDIASEFQGLQTIQLSECTRCHLQYFVPKFAVGSSHLYAQLEKFAWYYMPRKWEHDIALEDLVECKTGLEVGCGFGDFIARAHAEKGLNLEGIELNKSAVQEAQRRGLPVQFLDLQRAVWQFAGHYDAVCSFQVLEHVPHPRDFLEWSCALLKPRGKLILSVPNADSFLKHQFNILDMPPHHMTRWSSKTLSHLPNLLPLRLEHMKLEPLAEYHVDGYVNAYCSVLVRHDLFRKVWHPKLEQWLSKCIKRAGLRKVLTGQSLYASFVRV